MQRNKGLCYFFLILLVQLSWDTVNTWRLPLFRLRLIYSSLNFFMGLQALWLWTSYFGEGWHQSSAGSCKGHCDLRWLKFCADNQRSSVVGRHFCCHLVSIPLLWFSTNYWFGSPCLHPLPDVTVLYFLLGSCFGVAFLQGPPLVRGLGYLLWSRVDSSFHAFLESLELLIVVALSSFHQESIQCSPPCSGWQICLQKRALKIATALGSCSFSKSFGKETLKNLINSSNLK